MGLEFEGVVWAKSFRLESTESARTEESALWGKTRVPERLGKRGPEGLGLLGSWFGIRFKVGGFRREGRDP